MHNVKKILIKRIIEQRFGRDSSQQIRPGRMLLGVRYGRCTTRHSRADRARRPNERNEAPTEIDRDRLQRAAQSIESFPSRPTTTLLSLFDTREPIFYPNLAQLRT